MREPSPSRARLILIALWVLEGAVLIAGLGLYKKVDHPPAEYLQTPPGLATLAAVSVVAAAAVLLAVLVRRERNRVTPVVILQLASLGLAAAGAEAMIRMFAVETPEGPVFANTLLLPKRWDAIAAHHRSVLAKTAAEGSFLMADDYLGWTIAPGRSSRDYNRSFVHRLLAERRKDCSQPAPDATAPDESDPEIYFSSAEGLRSARAGVALAGDSARHRIALVGDSFTFGLEVPFEQTWGHELERILGDGTQVLNFGVDGYGVDQAVLRYRRDVVAWHPDLVILGMIQDDFRRALCVYGFLCFPGSEIPFAKPRFVSDPETPVNTPLPAPDAIFARASIADLPFVELDPAFIERGQWERRFYHHSYAVRFLISRFPRYPERTLALDDDAMKSLVAGLVGSFVRDAHAHGSRALVVFFPSHVSICGRESSRTSQIAQEAFAPVGIPFVDLTQCVDAVAPEERFVALHYSAATNAAVARCLADEIRRG